MSRKKTNKTAHRKNARRSSSRKRRSGHRGKKVGGDKYWYAKVGSNPIRPYEDPRFLEKNPVKEEYSNFTPRHAYDFDKDDFEYINDQMAQEELYNADEAMIRGTLQGQEKVEALNKLNKKHKKYKDSLEKLIAWENPMRIYHTTTKVNKDVIGTRGEKKAGKKTTRYR